MFIEIEKEISHITVLLLMQYICRILSCLISMQNFPSGNADTEFRLVFSQNRPHQTLCLMGHFTPNRQKKLLLEATISDLAEI